MYIGTSIIDGEDEQGKGARPKTSNILFSLIPLFSKRHLDAALTRLYNAHIPISVDSMIDACTDIQNEENTDLTKSSEHERLKVALCKVKDKYREMIEDITITCKMCRENESDILLLPCGHLVCCKKCLPNVRRCPVCNKVVRGTKEIFFA